MTVGIKMRIRVETSVGAWGDRTPCRLAFDGREVGVADLLDHWPGRDHHYFKVRGDDGDLYILRLDETSSEWELTMFQSGRGETVAA